MQNRIVDVLKKLNDLDPGDLDKLKKSLAISITSTNRHCLRKESKVIDLFNDIGKAYPSVSNIIKAVCELGNIDKDMLNDILNSANLSEVKANINKLKALIALIKPLGQLGEMTSTILNNFIVLLNNTPAIKIHTLIVQDEEYAKEQVKALRVQCDLYKKALKKEAGYDNDKKIQFTAETEAYRIAVLNQVPKHLSQTQVLAYKQYHTLCELTDSLDNDDSARDRVIKFKGTFLKNEPLLNQDRSPAAMKFKTMVSRILNEKHTAQLTNFFFGKPRGSSASFNQAAQKALYRPSI